MDDPAALAVAWHVTEDAIAGSKTRLREEWDGAELRTFTQAQLKGLLFLTVKGVLTAESAADRVAALRMVLYGTEGSAASRGRFARLTRLVCEPNDATWSAIPPSWQSFEGFVRDSGLTAWASAAESVVFFRDTVPGSLVQRAQLSGLCFMHGSDVVLHYAICKATARPDHCMVDLTAFMLRHQTGTQLWKFVDLDGGGSSIEFLQRLAGLKESNLDVLDVTRLRKPNAAEKVRGRMEKFGPALITRFRTNTNMKLPTSHSLIGEDPAEDSDGAHAMALVGWRFADDGTMRFLVQNWWKSKQFFECDVAYLASRRAHLVWINTPVTALPAEYSTTNAMFAENELDGEDRDVDDGAA